MPKAVVPGYLLALVGLLAHLATPTQAEGDLLAKLQNAPSSEIFKGIFCAQTGEGCVGPAIAPLHNHPSIVGYGQNYEAALAQHNIPDQIFLGMEKACNAEPIGPRTLLTSAHCLRTMDNTWHRVGPTQTVTAYSDNANLTITIGKPVKLCVLDGWHPGNAINDIGIILLADDLPIKPLELTVSEDIIGPAIMVGFLPRRIAASHTTSAVKPTDVVATRNDFLRRIDGVLCHRAGAVPGASGSALLTEPPDRVHCVHSSGSDDEAKCRMIDEQLLENANACAPITPDIKATLEDFMQAPDRSQHRGLICKTL